MTSNINDTGGSAVWQCPGGALGLLKILLRRENYLGNAVHPWDPAPAALQNALQKWRKTDRPSPGGSEFGKDLVRHNKLGHRSFQGCSEA